MKEQISAYIDSVFESVAGSEQVKDLKDELFANLCDHYDDLLAQGKTPPEAYRAVIDGMGDVRELREMVSGEGVGLPAAIPTHAHPGAAKEEAFGQVSELCVEWLSGEIQLLESEDGQVHVVETVSSSFPERWLFTAWNDGNRLVVKDPRRKYTVGILGLGWLAFHHTAALAVYLPRGCLSRIRIENVSGRISGARLEANDMHAETVSGKIELSGIFQEARVHTVSGGILWDASTRKCRMDSVSGGIRISGNVEECRVDSTSGPVEISLSNVPQSLSVSTVSGRVRLALPENSGFTFHLDKVSGRFSSDFELTEQNGTKAYKGGGAAINVSTVSGSCSLLRR